MYLPPVTTFCSCLTKPLKMILIVSLGHVIDRYNSRMNLLCGLLCQQKKRKKINSSILSFFDVTIYLEFNPDIISDYLKWSPVSNLRKFLRFTRGFLYRQLNSSTGCFSFPQLFVETFQEQHGYFVFLFAHRVTNTGRAPAAKITWNGAPAAKMCDTDHTLTRQDSTSSTAKATQDHKTSSESGHLYFRHFQNVILFFRKLGSPSGVW